MVDVTVTTSGGTSPAVTDDQFGYLSVSATATGHVYPDRASTISLGKYTLKVPAGVVPAATTATIYELAAGPDQQAGPAADFQIDGDWENGTKTVTVTMPVDPSLAGLGSGWGPAVEHYPASTDPDVYAGAGLTVDQAKGTVTVTATSLSPFISAALPQSILSTLASGATSFATYVQNQLRAFLGLHATPPSCDPDITQQPAVQTSGSGFKVSVTLGVPAMLYCVQAAATPDGKAAAQWKLTNNTGAVLQVELDSSGTISASPSGDIATDGFMSLLNNVQPAGTVLIPPGGTANVTVPAQHEYDLTIRPAPANVTASVFLLRETASLLISGKNLARLYSAVDNCVYNFVVNGLSRGSLSTCITAAVTIGESYVRRAPVIAAAVLLLDAWETMLDQVVLYLRASSLGFDAALAYDYSPLTITTTALDAAHPGQSYSFQLTATEPDINPDSFTWSADGLPDGLVMATDGEIRGTAASTGTYTAHIVVEDQSGNTDEVDLPLTVADIPPPPPMPAPPDSPFPTCTVNCGTTWGDPHLVTFDGAHFDFQQVGEFVLVKSSVTDLQVQVRQAPFGGTSKTVAANVAVAFMVAGHRVGVYLASPGVKTLVDGAQVTLAAGSNPLPGGGSIVDSGGTDQEAIYWPDGSFVSIDYSGVSYLTLVLHMAADQQGHLSGLLGNDDGNPDNDFTTSTGTVLPNPPSTADLYGTFSDSWRITQAESLFDYAAGQTTATFTDLNFPYGLESTATLPSADVTAATAFCSAAGVTTEPFLDDCVLDVVLTGDASTAAAAAIVASFAGGPSITFASGDGTTGSLDPNVTATDSCAGTTVQATIVAPYPDAWAVPIAGTQWDSVNSGYSGCNQIFTTTFTLPAGAVNPKLTITYLADNSADISVNGNQPFISGNVTGECGDEYSGSPTSGSTTSGLAAGANTLTFDVDNCYPAQGTSPTGIDFSAIVTYSVGGT